MQSREGTVVGVTAETTRVSGREGGTTPGRGDVGDSWSERAGCGKRGTSERTRYKEVTGTGDGALEAGPDVGWD